MGRKLQAWLDQMRNKRGVVLEVGAGFNTPSVIRWPGEGIVEMNKEWKLIRINLSDADVPARLGDRAVSLQGNATEIISGLL